MKLKYRLILIAIVAAAGTAGVLAPEVVATLIAAFGTPAP